jgi:hypothetical protein
MTSVFCGRYDAPMRRLSLVAALLLLVPLTYAADDTASSDKPVKVVADQLLPISSPRGSGQIPLYISLNGKAVDLSKPQPAITRAVLVFHGKLRNADVYNASGLRAIHTAGKDAEASTLLITPQFLAQIDATAFRLSASVLRWAPEAWMGGANALDAAGTTSGPSSFDVIDALLLHLADRKLFPSLKNVVLFGHSGGGQVLDRYAIVGTAGDTLIRAGIHVRYVVANPSSYLYFSPERPVLNPGADFTFAVPAKTCNGKVDRWKYGVNEPPPYAATADFHALEDHLLHRDVIFLLGTNDIDPNHPALDKTCSAEEQGPYRFFRGKAFFRYMENRHPDLAAPSSSVKLEFVPGVEHDGDKMLNSPCGLNAVFGVGACTTRVVDPKP